MKTRDEGRRRRQRHQPLTKQTEDSETHDRGGDGESERSKGLIYHRGRRIRLLDTSCLRSGTQSRTSVSDERSGDDKRRECDMKKVGSSSRSGRKEGRRSWLAIHEAVYAWCCSFTFSLSSAMRHGSTLWRRCNWAIQRIERRLVLSFGHGYCVLIFVLLLLTAFPIAIGAVTLYLSYVNKRHVSFRPYQKNSSTLRQTTGVVMNGLRQEEEQLQENEDVPQRSTDDLGTTFSLQSPSSLNSLSSALSLDWFNISFEPLPSEPEECITTRVKGPSHDHHGSKERRKSGCFCRYSDDENELSAVGEMRKRERKEGSEDVGPLKDRIALRDFFYCMDGNKWPKRLRTAWEEGLSTDSPNLLEQQDNAHLSALAEKHCQLPGVTCGVRHSHKRVTALSFRFQEKSESEEGPFEGRLPASLGLFAHLQRLHISGNEEEGIKDKEKDTFLFLTRPDSLQSDDEEVSVPSSASFFRLIGDSLSFIDWTRLERLTEIHLIAVGLRGLLPERLGALKSLQILDISWNQGISLVQSASHREKGKRRERGEGNETRNDDKGRWSGLPLIGWRKLRILRASGCDMGSAEQNDEMLSSSFSSAFNEPSAISHSTSSSVALQTTPSSASFLFLSQLFSLPHLEEAILTDNQLGPEIPPHLWKARGLKVLDLSHNAIRRIAKAPPDFFLEHRQHSRHNAYNSVRHNFTEREKRNNARENEENEEQKGKGAQKEVQMIMHNKPSSPFSSLSLPSPSLPLEILRLTENPLEDPFGGAERDSGEQWIREGADRASLFNGFAALCKLEEVNLPSSLLPHETPQNWDGKGGGKSKQRRPLSGPVVLSLMAEAHIREEQAPFVFDLWIRGNEGIGIDREGVREKEITEENRNKEREEGGETLAISILPCHTEEGMEGRCTSPSLFSVEAEIVERKEKGKREGNEDAFLKENKDKMVVGVRERKFLSPLIQSHGRSAHVVLMGPLPGFRCFYHVHPEDLLVLPSSVSSRARKREIEGGREKHEIDEENQKIHSTDERISTPFSTLLPHVLSTSNSRRRTFQVGAHLASGGEWAVGMTLLTSGGEGSGLGKVIVGGTSLKETTESLPSWASTPQLDTHSVSQGSNEVNDGRLRSVVIGPSMVYSEHEFEEQKSGERERERESEENEGFLLPSFYYYVSVELDDRQRLAPQSYEKESKNEKERERDRGIERHNEGTGESRNNGERHSLFSSLSLSGGVREDLVQIGSFDEALERVRGGDRVYRVSLEAVGSKKKNGRSEREDAEKEEDEEYETLTVNQETTLRLRFHRLKVTNGKKEIDWSESCGSESENESASTSFLRGREDVNSIVVKQSVRECGGQRESILSSPLSYWWVPCSIRPYLGSVAHFHFLHEGLRSLHHLHGRGYVRGERYKENILKEKVVYGGEGWFEDKGKGNDESERMGDGKKFSLVPVGLHECPIPSMFASVVEVTVKPLYSGNHRLWVTVRVEENRALVVGFPLFSYHSKKDQRKRGEKESEEGRGEVELGQRMRHPK